MHIILLSHLLLGFWILLPITNDISNIQSPAPYEGEDKVYVGDGKGLTKSHVGSSILHTPTYAFKLHNVQHMPQMQHNLLSAYQFLKNNHCILTLNSDGFLVKDRSTRKTLLMGQVRDGFYPLQCSSQVSNVPTISHFALISVKATARVWHKRLGHPSSPIFRIIINGNQLALHGKDYVDFFCNDGAIAKNHKLPFQRTMSRTFAMTMLLPRITLKIAF